ncbi:hypothetical protein KLP28_09390 [Nocardioidaceae bacterium]|nr:hypothetical protein KLP28_09390 [Nocardioidaceae bacterium]
MRDTRRVAYAARVALGTLALSLASAGAAYGSIADGAEDDNRDPVLVVTCHLVEGAPGEPPTEVCFEAQMGEGEVPAPAEPDPTEQPELTEQPEPTAEPIPEPEPTPEPGPHRGPSRQPPSGANADGPPTATVSTTTVTTVTTEAPSGDAGTEPAGSGSAPAVRRLPATGPSDVDLPVLALAVALVAGGGAMMRRGSSRASA